MMYWKVIGPGGVPNIADTDFRWPMPNGQPGEWTPAISDLRPCESGYHLCRKGDLVVWLGPEIYEAEARGALIEATDKIVCESARLIRKVESWNERTARLFAADCAERVLPLFEKFQPNDDMPRKAIEAARAFARGEITAAAWAAAGDAEREWQTKQLFAYLYGGGK